MIVAEFNTPLTVTDWTIIQKQNKYKRCEKCYNHSDLVAINIRLQKTNSFQV